MNTIKKFKPVFFTITVISFLTGFSLNNLKSSNEHPAVNTLDIPAHNIASVEYYISPAGDNRLWHVTNRYHKSMIESGSDEERYINNSQYEFSGDSVTVINDIKN